MKVSRRRALATVGAGIAAATVVRRVRAADPIKTAAIYTVPVEQQWVSRIHKAANAAKDRGDIDYVFSENVANTDYERVMREYSEAGHKLIVGEAFGVEDAARAVAKDYPKTAFLIGSSFKPDAALANFSVFDNYIQDASYLTGMIAGRHDQEGKHRHGRRLSDPRGQPADERLHGGREPRPTRTSSSRSPSSAPGSIRRRPRKPRFAQIDAGADVMYAERFGVSDAAKEKGMLAIGNVIDTQADYPDTVVASALWHFEPTLDHGDRRSRTGASRPKTTAPTPS